MATIDSAGGTSWSSNGGGCGNQCKTLISKMQRHMSLQNELENNRDGNNRVGSPILPQNNVNNSSNQMTTTTTTMTIETANITNKSNDDKSTPNHNVSATENVEKSSAIDGAKQQVSKIDADVKISATDDESDDVHSELDIDVAQSACDKQKMHVKCDGNDDGVDSENNSSSSNSPSASDRVFKVATKQNISKPNLANLHSGGRLNAPPPTVVPLSSPPNVPMFVNRFPNTHPTYLPPHIRNLPKTQSLDLADNEMPSALLTAKQCDGGSFEQNRPIYPNVPYSPYGSPFGSPRNRRRGPLRESRRISIEQSGSFLQLNQYKLMDQIGQGSYGLVKLAYSEEDSTHYAMKILSKRKLLRKAGLMGRGPKKGMSPLDRVYREIAVLKKLDHPNVVKLVEVLDDPLEDSLYLVFELLQLGEVLSVPTSKPLTEERVWSVLRDCVLGLEYLHYQRIIHGDIKPDNLLLGECGSVKIADLGVCNEFMGEDASMNNGSTAGTPAFRAPETLLTGQYSYSGKAADIWALGATLYSLVFGNVPFMANNVPAVYEKIKNDGLTFPSDIVISAELRDLITKMLEKDPSKRITLPQIKEHPWVTCNDAHPLPSEDDNCRLVEVNDMDINTVVKSIPKLDTLILIKTMLKKHSFQNPFNKPVSGRAPQRGGSRLERFTRAGRSNSAPGAYHMIERQMSSDNILPSVSEGVVSPCSETSTDADNAY
ncbi:calcium/calmodulin-dependent protein kinase kinase 1 isoform X2 [Contarinia nasturtii]|uniref:calcium/calmodulin-dependent protein kinase kinase 1 isoform X2 n=1 Tax=Contarinia nasturtii TaxID=265458 RepID=UPI0012D38D91|nr:calcium/calmodulin-dependent protein kinase kinase 1 isoform X2 [Contarinia nasturtii]XP_031625648.1 calcium/calmodulin-dependent protein kinase kinase 1 isoform X2 [Contarinia nasturtii]XP_031625649.1 calcium/calmodulin-dependent protein kinase kinase 1 isoform X2 [Contarinia nasturtii]